MGLPVTSGCGTLLLTECDKTENLAFKPSVPALGRGQGLSQWSTDLPPMLLLGATCRGSCRGLTFFKSTTCRGYKKVKGQRSPTCRGYKMKVAPKSSEKSSVRYFKRDGRPSPEPVAQDAQAW